MSQETFRVSQKELQRVAVIASCVKGDLAHASRGRPSHRRLPDAVRERIVRLARTTYAGFNDHHLCEKLVEREGFSLSRETLRRLLRPETLKTSANGKLRSVHYVTDRIHNNAVR
jgi:hypothetical protein